MNAGEVMRGASRTLSLADVDSPRRTARLLLAKAMDRHAPPCDVEDVTPGARAVLDELVGRRVANEPLAYILGHKEFWSLDFLVGPGALVPRPETETLIEELLKEFPNRERSLNLLDCGTGSGCLIVAALSMFPNARGLGIDAFADALSWASKNVARHGLENRCELRRCDWNHEIGIKYDAILANPPYIERGAVTALPPDVARYEPATSLIGGEDGLQAFRQLAPQIAERLKMDGVALLEIGEGQGESVREILGAAGLGTRRIVPDLAGIPRCVVAGLPE
jgi:release factor glutamine methyltransferase